MDNRTQLYKMSTLTMFFLHFHFLLSSISLSTSLHFYFYYWMDSLIQIYTIEWTVSYKFTKCQLEQCFCLHFHFPLSSLLLLLLNGQSHTTLQNVNFNNVFFHFHFLLSSLLLLPLNGQLHTTLQNVLSSLSLSTIFNFTFTIYFK